MAPGELPENKKIIQPCLSVNSGRYFLFVLYEGIFFFGKDDQHASVCKQPGEEQFKAYNRRDVEAETIFSALEQKSYGSPLFREVVAGET